MKEPIRVVRWVARITGLLVGGGFMIVLVATAINSLVEKEMEPPALNALVQLTVTLTGVAGLLLAWRWELAGGIVAIVSFAALGVINPGTIPIPLIPFLTSAILFLIAGWFNTETTGSQMKR